MRILIHTMNESLFPDADPLATVWTGPPAEIVAVQCLLYASLATSLFAAFVAMLGKQWVNRYVLNCGGSAEEKSRDRQRKLDGMGQWNFHIVMEGPPVMLQIALALLGCGLSLYLWSINRMVAGIVMAMTFFGFSFYTFLTLAATFARNCPYQTSPSLMMQPLVKRILQKHPWVVDLLPLALSTLVSAWTSTASVLNRLRSAILTLLRSPPPVVVPEGVPLTAVVGPIQIFDDAVVNWIDNETDACCVAWVLRFITDKDVILFAVRFAADIVLYPTIAKTLPPYLLAHLLFECIIEEEIVPGRMDQACSAGMALASVLSIQLCLNPECQHAQEICRRVMSTIPMLKLDGPTLTLVANALCLLAEPLTAPPYTYLVSPKYPLDAQMAELSRLRGSEDITCAFRCWLCRVLLQTVWRSRQLNDSNVMFDMSKIAVFLNALLKGRDSIPTAIKTTVVLTLAIALGQTASLDDLYVPDTKCVPSLKRGLVTDRMVSHALHRAFDLLHQRMTLTIATDNTNRSLADINPFFSILDLLHLDSSGTRYFCLNYLRWIEAILYSDHSMEARRDSAKLVVRLLGNPESPLAVSHCWTTHAPTLLQFLEFCEDCHQHNLIPTSTLQATSQLDPEIIALRYLRLEPKEEAHVRCQAPLLASVLTRVLRLDDRLKSRALGFEILAVLPYSWPSLPLYEGITPEMCARLVEAIGNPLQMNEPQPFSPTGELKHVGCRGCSCGADQFNAVGMLLGLTLSDGWRDHLRPFNFVSCAGIMSRERDRRLVLGAISRVTKVIIGSAEARVRSVMLMKAVDHLKGLGSYEAVQVIFLHIWSSDGIYSFDEESRKWLKRETVELLNTHGVERLKALAVHIKEGYDGRTGVERVPGLRAMCRLRELYQVIEWNPGQEETSGSPAVEVV